MKRRIPKAAAAIFIIAALLITAVYVLGETYIPDSFNVYAGEEFSYRQGLLTLRQRGSGGVAETSATGGDAYNATVMLFDLVPIKTVRVSAIETIEVVPGGMPFGVKMFTEGVIVVGFGDIQTASGPQNPAKNAGIALGDVIISIDGKKVNGNSDISAIVSASGGRALPVVFVRDEREYTVNLTPANSRDNSGYKAGMWVRDSTAGIGTVTYINEGSGMLGGLGHAITDSDTGLVMPVGSGEIVEVSITGIKKGQFGSPGELNGLFHSDRTIATLEYNGETGIIGALTNSEFYSGAAIPVALKQQVEKGPAKILTTIDESGPQYYDINIESVSISDTNPTKNIVIQITDPDLIAKTGGIVQGMSGSPIIQNGRLVGAVTHVFVNDPTKGYGIFAENIINSEQYVQKNLDEAA